MNLDAAIQTLRDRIPSLIAVYLYGSTARDQTRVDSDADLGVISRTAAASMPDDVILAKAEIIEPGLRRINEVYAGQTANLVEDFTKQ